MSLPTRSSAGAPARGAASLAISTTVDQVLSSASNALMVFVLAQVSSAGQFGIIGLLITVLGVCMGFDRGALGTPLLLTSNLTNRQIVAESNYALTWSLYTGAVGGFLILPLGAVFHHPRIGLAFAVALPVVLAQDVLRLTAIALGRPSLAVVADALWAAPMLGIFVANLFGVRESAEFSIYLWGFSGLVSAGILAFRLRIAPHHSRILDWWRTDWPARLRFGGVGRHRPNRWRLWDAYSGDNCRKRCRGGIRGAFTLFGPIATLLSALPMVFVPHAVRTGNSVGDQWRLVSRTSVATSVLTVVATGCLMAVPARLGAAILGASWPATLSVLPYIGVSTAALCWVAGVRTVFQSRGESRTIFGLSMLLVGLQLATSFAAGSIFRSAIAIAISLACSSSVTAIVGVLWVHRTIHAAAGPSGPRPGSAVKVNGDITEHLVSDSPPGRSARQERLASCPGADDRPCSEETC